LCKFFTTELSWLRITHSRIKAEFIGNFRVMS